MSTGKQNGSPPGSRGGRRLRRGLLLPVMVAVAVGVQLPLILGLSTLTRHVSLVVAGAALLTAGFISSFVGTRNVWSSPSRARLYLVLWPFFLWWTVALLGLVLGPLALVARWLWPAAAVPRVVTWLAVSGLGAGMALWQRPRIRRFTVDVGGLPAEFDGYRVAQISDLHCGPFASGARVAGWVAAVNRLAPDLIAVTGDLIASGSAFVPVVASALGALRAPDGVVASMGNHDYFTDGDALASALERAGLAVLRNRGVDVVRGHSVLHIAGADDTWTRRADVAGALAGRRPGTPAILLAHDPELFPEAASQGVALTLSGHTHGGQVAVPLLARRLNLARLMTPFTSGLYQVGPATLYVNRGLGTTGPPVRLGVPPEIAVFTLRRVAVVPADAQVRPAGALDRTATLGVSAAAAATANATTAAAAGTD